MTILDTAKPAEGANRESYLIKALLIGKSGGGKTTSAALTLPKPVLVIDYDGRSQGLAGIPGISVLQILPNSKDSMLWKEKVETLTEEIWTAVRKKTLTYKSIHEAGLTAMNRMSMYWALLLDPKKGLGGSPAKQHYPPQMKNLMDHILSMLALPVNYTLEAHYEIVEDEEEGGTIFLPKLFGKGSRTELPGLFNECYHCYHASSKDGKEKYFWHTSGFGRFDFMKSSINNPLGKYWTDPIEIDLAAEPAGFQKLLELRFGKEKANEEKIVA